MRMSEGISVGASSPSVAPSASLAGRSIAPAVTGRDAEVLSRLLRLLSATFAHVWVYMGSPDDPQSKDNNIVIATDRPHRFEEAWEVDPEGEHR